jgi:hypothetical protein
MAAVIEWPHRMYSNPDTPFTNEGDHIPCIAAARIRTGQQSFCRLSVISACAQAQFIEAG